MEASLRVTKGKKLGESYLLKPGARLVIGRDVSSDIQMFDPGLSRTHLMIETTDQGIQITDLNSSNGTYVNGKRVIRATISMGDTITVGEAQLTVEKPRPKSAEDPLLDMVQNLFEEQEPKIKKRFQVSESGLIDLSSLEEKSKHSDEIAKNLEAIYKVSAYINTTEDITEIYNNIMDTIYEVLEPDRSFLIMKDDEKDVIEPVVIRKKPGETGGARTNISTKIVKEAMTNGLSVLSHDAMEDDRFKGGDSIVMNNIRSVMCVPVEATERILGAIYVDNVSSTNMFNEDHLQFLTALGKQAGVAIRRWRLIEDLENLYYNLVQALVATIEAKDQYTSGHSERVTDYAVELATAMRLDPDMVNQIRLGGLLHDIGKIGIPESVLNKPGRLDEDEWRLIRTHPRMGAQILKNISNIEDVISLVEHHHESYDGTGYPDGLAGEDIPLGARVLAVADTFDAMTSKRPYRDGLPMEVVIKEFNDNLGIQFDRKIAEVFLWLIEKGKIQVDKSAAGTMDVEVDPENKGEDEAPEQ